MSPLLICEIHSDRPHEQPVIKPVKSPAGKPESLQRISAVAAVVGHWTQVKKPRD